jgi:hypothetical protein
MREGNERFDLTSIEVTVENEGGGDYLKIKCMSDEPQEIAIDFDELEYLVRKVRRLRKKNFKL